MTETDFGHRLRSHRLQTSDPAAKKPLTQQRLGELLGMELGRSAFTGAAVSDWERGESRINADERVLLISLVKILEQFGGIKTPDEANRLLESGNFRALNPQEMVLLFPGRADEDDPPNPAQNPTNAQFLFENMNFPPAAEYRRMLEKAKQGPAPFWPRMAVSLIRKFTDGLTPSHVLKGIIWVWTAWLADRFFISPSLAWNFPHRDAAVADMVVYAAGSLILPFLVGGMTNTKDNAYWIEQNMQSAAVLRLYVYQGAFVGFHVGYFMVLLLTPAQILLGLGSPGWLDLARATFPIMVAYAGAQLVPYNLWLAYHRLRIKDGGVFFVFVLLGPLWAWFFLRFYGILASPVMGAVVFLIALTIIAAVGAVKQRKSATDV